MAGIGMYGVYYAKAVVTDGVVTGYTGGVKTMGKAISATFTPSTAENNPLYANNGVAEDDASGASGGELKMVLDRLTQDAAADMFGVETIEVSVTPEGASAPVTGKGLKYTGLEQAAVLGVAYIRQNQISGNRNHHEVVLYRNTTFAMPAEVAKTIGEKIEWQNPELTGTVAGLEGDGTNAWYEAIDFPTQAAAIAYINQYFAESEPAAAEVNGDEG